MDKEKEGLSTSAQEAITNAAKANVDAFRLPCRVEGLCLALAFGGSV
jgi:hypothetical protein